MKAERTDRLPPHAPEAEQGVLGCMLLSPTTIIPALVAKNSSGAEIFYDLRHQTIYSAMVKMADKGEPVDVITLQQRLKDRQMLDQIGGIPYLNALQDGVPSAANLDYYFDIVTEKFQLRQMIYTCTDIVGQVYDTEATVDELQDQVERDILALRNVAVEEMRPAKELVNQAITDIETIFTRQGKISGVSSGFPDFDQMTDGFHAGEMVIIAGRPSTGKTSLAMNIAEHVALNEKLAVGVFSLEMTAEALMLRSLCTTAHVNLRNIRDGYMAESDFPKLTHAAGRLRNAPLHIDDKPGLSILQLRARARRLWQQHSIKLFVIDYVQLLHSTSKRAKENRQQEISDISSGIKTLAKELRVPIIVLAQLNRDIEKDKHRKPRMSDLRESGCLSVATTRLLTSSGVLCNDSSRMNTYSLNNSGEVVTRASKNIPKGVSSIVRVVLGSGRFIDCTPNHPILTDEGWVAAGKLNHQSVAAVRRIEEPKNTIPIPESKWIGWMLGNGSMVGYASPSFICSCEAVAADFCKETNRIFNLNPKPHHHSCAKVWQYDITAGPVRTSAGNQCKDWLRAHDLWGRKSNEKRIPQWLTEQADNKSLALLIAGLWETDGTVTNGILKFSTTSNEMAWQMVWVLSRLGIFAYLDNGYLSKKANYPIFTVSIQDGRDIAKFQSNIPIIGRKGEKLMAIDPSSDGSNHGDRVGVWVQGEIKKAKMKSGSSWSEFGYRVQGKRISQQDLGRLIEKHPKHLSHLSHLVNPNIYWEKVESVMPAGKTEVFDREVIDGPHNFVANGIIVHNSLEQDGDLVGLLYKPERDKDETQRTEAEAVNLLIAKQRNGPTGDVNLTFLKQFTRFESAAKVDSSDVPD